MKVDKEWIKNDFTEWVYQNSYIEDWEDYLNDEKQCAEALAFSVEDYFTRNGEEIKFEECKEIAQEMLDNGDVFIGDLIATAFKKEYPNLYAHISTCENPYK